MRLTFRFQAAAGVLVCSIVASGCSSSATAPSPSRTSASQTSSGADSQLVTQHLGLSIEDLESRGWDCRPAPLAPTTVTCSHPNQLHPVLIPGPPPPEDRPALIRLHVFDNGIYAGTSVLVRSNLYQGQPCPSTGGPYRFIARIGYYECRF